MITPFFEATTSFRYFSRGTIIASFFVSITFALITLDQHPMVSSVIICWVVLFGAVRAKQFVSSTDDRESAQRYYRSGLWSNILNTVTVSIAILSSFYFASSPPMFEMCLWALVIFLGSMTSLSIMTRHASIAACLPWLAILIGATFSGYISISPLQVIYILIAFAGIYIFGYCLHKVFEEIDMTYKNIDKERTTHIMLNDVLGEDRNDFVWGTNQYGEISKISKNFESITGFKPDAIINRDAEKVLTWMSVENETHRIKDFRDHLVKGEKFEPIEYHSRNKFGEIRIRIITGWPNFDETTDDFLGFNGWVRDITKQREFENAVRNREIDLQRRVDKATASVKQEIKNKQRFLAKMNHELRTPLNPLVNLSSHLKEILDPQSPQAVREIVDILHASAERILAIANEVLDYSKIELNTISIHAEEINLKNILEDAVALMAGGLASEETVSFFDYGHNIPQKFLADGARLTQVFSNILSNAYKFTDKGYVSVDVNGYIETDTSYKIFIRFKDTGRGISEEDVPKIFAEYEQVNPSYGDVAGTGLGMPISRKMVTAMGGDITAAGTPGEGSIFTVELVLESAGEGYEKPRTSFEEILAIEEDGIMEELSQAVAASASLPVRFVSDYGEIKGLKRKIVFSRETGRFRRDDISHSTLFISFDCNKITTQHGNNKPSVHTYLNIPDIVYEVNSADRSDADEMTDINDEHDKGMTLHVLVVDDNSVNVMVLETMLHDKGVSVDVSMDGRDAVENMIKKSYDLVLLDFQLLDGFNGDDVTKAIRNHEKLNGISPTYIVGLSAAVFREDREKAICAGMNEYYSKPVRLDDLKCILQKARRLKLKKEGEGISPEGILNSG